MGMTKMMKRIFAAGIVIYQRAISPWIGPHCRFYPSCSEWSRQAIETYGIGKGLGLSLKRLLSCHPFHPGGYEPLIPRHG